MMVRTGTYTGTTYVWGRITKGRTGTFKSLKNGVGMSQLDVNLGSGQTRHPLEGPPRTFVTSKSL